jgi:hypothetical protein
MDSPIPNSLGPVSQSSAGSEPSPNLAPKDPPHIFKVPEGVFSQIEYNIESPRSPGFNNAKPISMLERGWRLMATNEFDILKGKKRDKEAYGTDILVLLTEDDGPEYQARLIGFQAGSSGTMSYSYIKDIFTFQSLDSTHTWTYTRGEIGQRSLKIYIKTDPVPFVYTMANARAKAQAKGKTRKSKQRGGFYPSVYAGVSGATMLTPLIARQMMRMYETRKTRRHSKKINRRKTRSNA